MLTWPFGMDPGQNPPERHGMSITSVVIAYMGMIGYGSASTMTLMGKPDWPRPFSASATE